MKWAMKGENRALLDITNQVWELNNIWVDAQTKFIGEKPRNCSAFVCKYTMFSRVLRLQKA